MRNFKSYLPGFLTIRYYYLPWPIHCIPGRIDQIRILITCGESLLKAAAHVRDCFTEDTPAAAEEPAPVTEPVAETPAPKAYTKEEVRAILADLSQNGFRNEAKALVRKYSDGGSLTDIDPAKYPDLVAEAEALHG